ncbi:MAG: pyridoxamine 5'-phosphate oxidase family protein [Chloroflexota bacterium]|jgi:hypothetical protein|nr:pyridoxamine 5'-phosphate oxidase family protein [Chloroflexota bacterium]
MADPRLDTERNIWLATTRPDGRPHLTPIWFVWMHDKIYFCTQGKAVKTRNLTANPNVAFSLENGDKPAIGEGVAKLLEAPFPTEIVAAFKTKYNWDMNTDPGYTALFEIAPQKWLSW